MILETERLYLREMNPSDSESLCKILQDKETMQPWKEDEVLEIGYLFERQYWHNGYATEAAIACKKYAFEKLDADEVCSIIRDSNIASQKVAIRNCMIKMDTWTKHYKGVDMPHYRYVVYR